MLDIKRIRENFDGVRAQLARRGGGVPQELETLIKKDTEYRDKLRKVEALKNQKNTLSQEVGRLKQNGEDAASQMDQVKSTSLPFQGPAHLPAEPCPKSRQHALVEQLDFHPSYVYGDPSVPQGEERHIEAFALEPGEEP